MINRNFYKTFSFLVILLALVFHVNGTFAESTSDAKTIIKLENTYFQALENQDEALMDSLLSDNFVISSMTSDWSMNKEEFLKTIPKQVMTSQEITEVKVEVSGKKANSQVDITMTKTYNGDDHSGDYEVYSVWQKEGGGWKLTERKIKLLKPKG